MDSLLAQAHSHLFTTAKMRSDLFHHIMVLIYNNGISCQMDVRMNISLTYSTAWTDSRMDIWRKMNLQLTQWSYIVGLPRIVFSGQEIGTFSKKVWFSF